MQYTVYITAQAILFTRYLSRIAHLTSRVTPHALHINSHALPLTISGNERYYSFGVGMVYFVAVSTDESIDPSSTQGVWLDVSILLI